MGVILSYPLRVIRRNTSRALKLHKAKIEIAAGVKSRVTWEPEGGNWHRYQNLPTPLSNANDEATFRKEIANDYILCSYDDMVIPHPNGTDLAAIEDIDNSFRVVSYKETSVLFMYVEEILDDASAHLRGKIGSNAAAEWTPAIEVKFEAELQKKIETETVGSVSIDYVTVAANTGLPGSMRTIKSWEKLLPSSIGEFLNEEEPAIVTGVCGFVLRGFENSVVVVSESSFTGAAQAALEDTSILSSIGVELNEVAASWKRSVNKKLEMRISQVDKRDAFYPLWIQRIDYKDVN